MSSCEWWQEVFGGRSLAAPPPGVRPTSDRVRESIFARLGGLDGLEVLDLFAGTGALGIEALSRGAKALVAVDRAPQSVAAIERNLEQLGVASFWPRLCALRCAEPFPTECRGKCL